MSSRMHWTKKMVALIFAALFILSPVTSFASAGGITGEANHQCGLRSRYHERQREGQYRHS